MGPVHRDSHRQQVSHLSSVAVHYCILPEIPTDPAWKEKSREILDDHEFRRLIAFRHIHHQWIFAAAHVLLRKVLAEYLNCKPATLAFSIHSNGKPFVNTGTWASPPAFNLTHTRSGVAISVASAGMVGVDIEAMCERTSLDGLVNRTFSESERATWQTLDRSQQRDHFFRIWTLKEACTKAEGKGISHAFNTLSFDLSGTFPRLTSGADGFSLQYWNFAQWLLAPNYVLSAALAHHSEQSVHWELKRMNASDVFESDGM